MRNKKRFSEIGNILQSKVVQSGETTEIFNLQMPENYIGFLYYLANDYFPLKLNIDGEEININGIIAPIDSPQVYNPPYIIKNFIKVSVTNTSEESKTIHFYADGIAYSVLTLGEETLIKEIKGKTEELSQATITSPVNVKEIIPTTAHIINHNLHNANQWYEIKLSHKLVTWQLRCRGSHEIKYSYSPTHQTWMTLASNEVLSSDVSPNKTLNAIWVMCETANVIIELETWTK